MTAIAESGKLDHDLLEVLRDPQINQDDFIPVIVRVDQEDYDAAMAMIEGVGGHVTRRLTIIGAVSANVPQSRVAELGGAEMITRIELDRNVSIMPSSR